MWNNIAKHLQGHPERIAVAKLLIETGLSIRDGKIYCKSRSEAEHSLVSGLIVNGIRNFEQIDKIMMACKIGKWQEDRSGSYKRKTFEKALSFVKTTKVPISDFERLKRSITKIKK